MPEEETTRVERTFDVTIHTRTSRGRLEVHETECPDCGTKVSRVMDSNTYEWEVATERCWQCGAKTPWERGWKPV